jgi:hypothetical protein
MKFSPETIKVLKTFSAINPNLLLKEGNQLSTISPQRNVMAEVTIAETIPSDFGIYNLTEFLGVLSLFSDAEIEFADKIAVIKEGRSSIKYFASDPSLLVVPQKALNFPESVIDFTLTGATLNTAIKTAGVLRSTDIAIEGDGTDIFISVADLKNPNANSFKVVVGSTDKTFKANLKVENLKMTPGDYDISLTSKKVSRWKSTTQEASFYVALEATSTMF